MGDVIVFDEGGREFLTRPCPACGRRSRVQVDPDKLARWVGGEFVQRVWPEASAGQRELLMTGFHEDCFDAAFGDEEE